MLCVRPMYSDDAKPDATTATAAATTAVRQTHDFRRRKARRNDCDGCSYDCGAYHCYGDRHPKIRFTSLVIDHRYSDKASLSRLPTSTPPAGTLRKEGKKTRPSSKTAPAASTGLGTEGRRGCSSVQVFCVPPQGQVHGALDADDARGVLRPAALLPGLPEEPCGAHDPAVRLIVEVDHVVHHPVRVHDARELPVAVEFGLLRRRQDQRRGTHGLGQFVLRLALVELLAHLAARVAPHARLHPR